MEKSLTEYQKGSIIINLLIKGNDATFTLTMSAIDSLPIIEDLSEAWLEKIPMGDRVSKELAVKALEWYSLKNKKNFIEKEDAFTISIKEFIKAVTIFIGHNPSAEEIYQLLTTYDNRLHDMHNRNAAITSFNKEIYKLQVLYKKSRNQLNQTPLSRLLQERKTNSENQASAESRRIEEKNLDDSMKIIRNWEIMNDKRFSSE